MYLIVFMYSLPNGLGNIDVEVDSIEKINGAVLSTMHRIVHKGGTLSGIDVIRKNV